MVAIASSPPILNRHKPPQSGVAGYLLLSKRIDGLKSGKDRLRFQNRIQPKT
jgi:hypothetical protein